ncbi:MAG: hypothetical protein H7A25_11235 [Leptospiraceae bacterium]|nr:hypothetical protein [Leptospiraceae bacterium]MCP5500469.1 hypothetical protein [Leptospiraceae bacterium]
MDLKIKLSIFIFSIILFSCQLVSVEETKYPTKVDNLYIDIPLTMQVKNDITIFINDEHRKWLSFFTEKGLKKNEDKKGKRIVLQNLSIKINANIVDTNIGRGILDAIFSGLTLGLHSLHIQNKIEFEYILLNKGKVLLSKKYIKYVSYYKTSIFDFYLYLDNLTYRTHQYVLFQFFGELIREDIVKRILYDCFFLKTKNEFCDSIKVENP